MIKIDEEKCPQDRRCVVVSVCPRAAISQEGFSLPKISVGMCVECLECVKNCPFGAIYQTIDDD